MRITQIVENDDTCSNNDNVVLNKAVGQLLSALFVEFGVLDPTPPWSYHVGVRRSVDETNICHGLPRSAESMSTRATALLQSVMMLGHKSKIDCVCAQWCLQKKKSTTQDSDHKWWYMYVCIVSFSIYLLSPFLPSRLGQQNNKPVRSHVQSALLRCARFLVTTNPVDGSCTHSQCHFVALAPRNFA